ncbi:MAG TPA: hypothetical protein VH835_11255 [Dongiaceae bacterium]
MSARNAIDREALRGLIRQVLRDAVPADVQKKLSAALAKKGSGAKAAPAPKPASAKGEQAEEIAIASDGDLNRFVQRLLAMAEDSSVREALRSGQRKFRLAKSAVSSSAAPRPQQREESRRPTQNTGGSRIDKGLVAERHIVAAAKNGGRLTVAKGVAVTPLARDKARQLGVVIERE